MMPSQAGAVHKATQTTKAWKLSVHETFENSNWLMVADDERSMSQLLADVRLWRATAVVVAESSLPRRNFTGDRGSWGSPTKFATAQYTERASVLRATALAHCKNKNTLALLHDIN